MTAGKFLRNMDLINIEVVSISRFWSILINLITLSGLVLGYISYGIKKNHFLSSLFFLSPSLGPKPLMVIKSLNSLDYG